MLLSHQNRNQKPPVPKNRKEGNSLGVYEG